MNIYENIREALEEELSCRVVVQFRGKLLLGFTPRKTYLIKEIRFPTAEIAFIHQTQSFISRSGSPAVIPYLEFHGVPWLNTGAGNYVVKEYLPGRNPHFHDPAAWRLGIQALASLHLNSGSYAWPSIPDTRNFFRRWGIRWDEKMAYLSSFHQRHESASTPFASLFRNSYPFFAEMMRKNRFLLEKSVALSGINGVFCHHDLTERNLLWTEKRRIILLDWENGIYDAAAHDLARLLLYHLFVLPPPRWKRAAKSLLDAYNFTRPLSGEDFILLHIFSLWPQKYWRMVRQYEENYPFRPEMEYCRLFMEIIKFYENLYRIKPFLTLKSFHNEI
ncbi:MAG: phosphotransferase [Bacillota bacterium]